MDCRCTITITDLPEADWNGPQRWLASCAVCQRTYKTATSDPARHYGRHRTVECREKGPCSRRGLVMRSLRGAGCGGKPFALPVYACAEFGECTLRKVESVEHACAGCPKYTE